MEIASVSMGANRAPKRNSLMIHLRSCAQPCLFAKPSRLTRFPPAAGSIISLYVACNEHFATLEYRPLLARSEAGIECGRIIPECDHLIAETNLWLTPAAARGRCLADPLCRSRKFGLRCIAE